MLNLMTKSRIFMALSILNKRERRRTSVHQFKLFITRNKGDPFSLIENVDFY